MSLRRLSTGLIATSAAILLGSSAAPAAADPPNTYSQDNEFMGGNRHYLTWSSMDTWYSSTYAYCPRVAGGVRTKSGDALPAGWLGVRPRLYNWDSQLIEDTSWSYSFTADDFYQRWIALSERGTQFRSKTLAKGWSTTSDDYALGYGRWTGFISAYNCNL